MNSIVAYIKEDKLSDLYINENLIEGYLSFKQIKYRNYVRFLKYKLVFLSSKGILSCIYWMQFIIIKIKSIILLRLI